MSRQLFNHLFVELSVSVGVRLPRYALWLEIHHLGWNPEVLRLAEALTFCESPVDEFLAHRGLSLTRRARRRLIKALGKFDPIRPLPHDRVSSWMESE